MTESAAATAATTSTAPVEGSGPPSGAEGAAPPPAPPTHVQDAVKAQSFAERMAKAKAVFSAAGEKPKLEKPEPADAEPSEKAETAPEPEAAKAKPETPEKPDAKADAAHARALAALRKAESENLRLKSESKAAADKLAAERDADRAAMQKLQAQLDAIMKDPVAALKASGKTADQFMRDVVEGKIKPPAPEDALREQMTEKLSPLEQRLADAEAKLKAREEAEKAATQEREARAAYERNLETTKKVITAEDYPITAALGAYETVLKHCYDTGSDDIAAKAAEFEAHQLGLLENLLTPQVLAALAKRSAKIRETVGTGKGAVQSRQTTGSSGGPRVAARDVVSAPTTPVERPKTEAERMARAKALLSGARS